MSHIFILRTHNENALSTILLRIREGQDQVKISTKIQVWAKDWDSKRQRVRPSDISYRAKNASLSSWDTVTQTALLHMADDGWTLDQVRDAILKAKNQPAARTDDNSLLEYYHHWATTRSESRKVIGRNRILSWRILSEFRTPLSFSAIDDKFYEDFCRWMDEVKGYKENMKGTQIKNLKAVMNAALRDKLHDNTDYQRFRKQQEEVDAVYLTEQELDAIYALPLTGYKAKARDIFLVGCYTAMRWSDYSRLEKKDVTDDTIYFTHKKTGFRVSIPLHPIVREILDRYDGKVPEISEQKLNTYIKEVCRDAGLTQPVTRVFFKGGKRVEEVKAKCDLVTSHTARRTAATNMYKHGVPAYNIMLITGHTSEATFRKYIKFEKEKNAELMRDNPYFRKRDSEGSPSGR
jgi:integrase